MVLKRRKAVEKAPTTAEAWLKKRRTEAAAMGTAIGPVALSAGRKGARAWTEQHEAEAQRQKKLRLERLCAEVVQGTADTECLTSAGATTADVRRYTETEAERQRSLNQKWQRQHAVTAPPQPLELNGRSAYITPEARATATGPKWRDACRRSGCVEVADRIAASVFVVLNLCQ